MVCKHTDCARHKNCGILDILGSMPKTFNSCSYGKTVAQDEKNKKKLVPVDTKAGKKIRKEAKHETKEE